MTTTIVIGENVKSAKKLVPIKFEGLLDVDGSGKVVLKNCNMGSFPKAYNYIELISRGYTNETDLMFAYVDPTNRKNGVLYIGKWNDGVVE